MLRILLTVILPLLLPAAIYFGWLWWVNRQGGTAPEAKPWGLLAAAGVALALVTVGGFALIGGAPAGTDYQPARMEDGRLVPGSMGNQ